MLQYFYSAELCGVLRGTNTPLTTTLCTFAFSRWGAKLVDRWVGKARRQASKQLWEQRTPNALMKKKKKGSFQAPCIVELETLDGLLWLDFVPSIIFAIMSPFVSVPSSFLFPLAGLEQYILDSICLFMIVFSSSLPRGTYISNCRHLNVRWLCHKPLVVLIVFLLFWWNPLCYAQPHPPLRLF